MENADSTSSEQRSQTEVDWDKEFGANGTKGNTGFAQTLGDLAQLAARVAGTLAQAPNVKLPDEARQHTRTAVREAFLALRSFSDAVSDNIERMLADPDPSRPSEPVEASGQTQGPDGTWGNSRRQPATASSQARRIEVSDEASGTSGDSPGLSGDDEVPEDRGMRAEIDY